MSRDDPTTIPVRNPRTGLIDHHIRRTAPAEVDRLAAELRAAQPEWLALGVEGRAAALAAFADAIDARAPAILAALEADTGRRLIARIELQGVTGVLRRWAARAPELIRARRDAWRPASAPGVSGRVRLVPHMLFGAVAPWNFPMLLAMIDAVPALAVGCAALVKPSEVAPRFIAPLRDAIAAVPDLEPVLKLVEGDAATGDALVQAVDYVCFTGSVETGRKVAVAAAQAMTVCNLELGGKDPLIVLPSADHQRAAAVALRGSIAATGQACQSIERVYVARSLAERFLAELVAQAEAVRLSYPDPGAGELGPFIFAPQADKVAAQLADARAKGARVLTGGDVETLGGGRWLRPTVLTDVTPDMAVMAEETFGPVIPVVIYDHVDEAIVAANASDYGLSAAVLGDPAEAEAVAERLEAGAVSINDAAMTSMVWDVENSSMKASGMGPSRMGDEGFWRFFVKQGLIRRDGEPMPIAAFAEENAR